MEMLDVIIIGAGPIGLSCGIEAERRCLNYLIMDKGPLVNTLYHFPVNMTFFSTSVLLEIGGVPFISHQDKPTRKEALEYYRRVYETWNLKCHFYEKVNSVTNQDNHFKVKTVKGTYLSKFIILSTGFYDKPNLMNVPGEELDHVKHYYDDPHLYIGQKVVVVGAANSACDVALELYHKGADVTMIIRESEISDRVKYWIKPNIENRIKEGSIKAHFNSQVDQITKEEVHYSNKEGKFSTKANFVLAMTGYQPDFSFLKSIGLSFEQNVESAPTCDDITHETNIPGIYMAGVVCGGKRTNKYFIENSRDHAEKIFTHISRKAKLEF